MESPSTTQLLEELESALDAVEHQWQVGVVLKSYDPAWRRADGGSVAAPRRRQHRHPHCLATKRADYASCAADCLHDLPAQCAGHARAFARRCHAGVRELVVPIRLGEQVAATISLGPLPRTRAGRERIRTAAELLGGYAQDWQERYRRAREAGGADLLTRTIAAIDRHLASGARLEAVARDLHCSPAWASRRIARECGCSYSQLRDRRRLQLACQRLREGDHSIEAIARACGFPHPTYFYQVFRKAFGCAPGAWRKQEARRAEV